MARVPGSLAAACVLPTTIILSQPCRPICLAALRVGPGIPMPGTFRPFKSPGLMIAERRWLRRLFGARLSGGWGSETHSAAPTPEGDASVSGKCAGGRREKFCFFLTANHLPVGSLFQALALVTASRKPGHISCLQLNPAQ